MANHDESATAISTFDFLFSDLEQDIETRETAQIAVPELPSIHFDDELGPMNDCIGLDGSSYYENKSGSSLQSHYFNSISAEESSHCEIQLLLAQCQDFERRIERVNHHLQYMQHE